MEGKKILIIGGVAGGATSAARFRRLCESCQITVIDKGPYVSFANCGLPYYVGDVIKKESKLTLVTPELFKERFLIDVRVENEALSIDRQKKVVEIRDIANQKTYQEPYDYLIIATGSKALKPPIPGIDLPGLHALRTIPDSRKLKEAVRNAKNAVVVGGGFIGLEVTENLVLRGLKVDVVEMAPQVMPPLDPELAHLVSERLVANGVNLHLSNKVKEFQNLPDGKLKAILEDDTELTADIILLSMGVRPESSLAAKAGLELGELGGIRVDEHMRTSDPNIWAVGDVVEVKDTVTGNWQLIPLAGPANRQGRIAAASIVAVQKGGSTNSPSFRGVQATAVCGVFSMTAAMTGASEKILRRCGITDYEKVYLHPGNHVGYYPGAKSIHMKLLYRKGDGKILGAQAVGEEGVERRIDVIAMAIQKEGNVYDLEEAELCYAPQYGAAKDPINLAGMISANNLRGDLPLAAWEELDVNKNQLIDVRTEAEYSKEHIDGAVNIPLHELRQRLDELQKQKEVWLVCGVGQRAYYATRLLMQNGYNVRNLSGGMQTWAAMKAAGQLPGAE